MTSQISGLYDKTREMLTDAIESKRLSLETIVPVKQMLSNWLSRYYENKEQLERIIHQQCKTLANGLAPKWIRKNVVLVLYLQRFHNYQISRMLKVSVRTIGRDLAELKKEYPSYWKMRF